MPYEPSKLMAPPREATPGWRSIPIWAGVFVIVGGVLQGMGVNIQRYSNSDVAWGGLGVLIGGAVSIWFARRLRWWLLLYIPAIWIAMVPIALASELMTAGFFSRAGDQDASCRGWRHLNAELAPISTAISAYTNDLASATNPGSDDARRWAAAATSIRKQYEELDHPPVLDRYVAFSTQTFRSYEQGFGAMATGNYESGQALLEQGDSTLPQAQAAFRAASAECAS